MIWDPGSPITWAVRSDWSEWLQRTPSIDIPRSIRHTERPGRTCQEFEAYLHDGRARTLEEAILWHGGETEASMKLFRNMSASDRDALISFLESL